VDARRIAGGVPRLRLCLREFLPSWCSPLTCQLDEDKSSSDSPKPFFNLFSKVNCCPDRIRGRLRYGLGYLAGRVADTLVAAKSLLSSACNLARKLFRGFIVRQTAKLRPRHANQLSILGTRIISSIVVRLR
jgi:hypothetical protein